MRAGLCGSVDRVTGHQYLLPGVFGVIGAGGVFCGYFPRAVAQMLQLPTSGANTTLCSTNTHPEAMRWEPVEESWEGNRVPSARKVAGLVKGWAFAGEELDLLSAGWWSRPGALGCEQIQIHVFAGRDGPLQKSGQGEVVAFEPSVLIPGRHRGPHQVC